MAIAPVLDQEGFGGERWGARSSRPALYLVEPPGDGRSPGRPGAVRTGLDVVMRRRERAAARARRRRLAVAAFVAALVTGLALPVSALGGRPVAGAAGQAGQTGGTSAVVAGSPTSYVVQPGDTLRSIAVRFDGGGDPGQLTRELGRELGSTVVVPGERIMVP